MYNKALIRRSSFILTIKRIRYNCTRRRCVFSVVVSLVHVRRCGVDQQDFLGDQQETLLPSRRIFERSFVCSRWKSSFFFCQSRHRLAKIENRVRYQLMENLITINIIAVRRCNWWALTPNRILLLFHLYNYMGIYKSLHLSTPKINDTFDQIRVHQQNTEFSSPEQLQKFYGSFPSILKKHPIENQNT